MPAPTTAGNFIMKKLLIGIAILPFLTAAPAFAQAQVPGAILNAPGFTSTGARQPLTGTQLCISQNMPGGNWLKGAGDFYYETDMLNCIDYIDVDTWGRPYKSNVANTFAPHTILAFPIASAGDYVKPSKFNLTVHIGGYLKTGVGFWSQLPVSTGVPNINWVKPELYFTGILIDWDTQTLTLYENGVAAGSPAPMPGQVVD